MQLSVLGPVLIDGKTPPGAKERALLARLLVTPGTPVAADALIEAAWPDDRPGGVVRSLHVRVAKLRSLLGGDVLVREPSGYRLTVAPEALDAHRFTRMAEEAARLAPEASLKTCDAALALWRGEPFADLEAVDAATTVEARRLHGVRERLRHLHAVALRELGRAAEAADELDALVEEDPLREELVRDLMLARYRAGRQVEALDAYRELAKRLAEVGLQPGPEVRELEALMLHHAEELAPAAPGPRRHPTNVGARVASVVGRDGELAAIERALGEHRIVTLVGPGGVGKTTLAVEAARRLLDRLPDGAWVTELAPLSCADEVLPAVGMALGMRRVGTGADEGDLDALGVLRERLRDARLLVVLDRAEHLVPELGAVAAELAGLGDGIGVLVTSRRPLGVSGEAVVPVAPLGAAAARQLFVDRARAARPDFAADAGDEAVRRICDRLDGLPLALELAAARLRALSADAIAERLDSGLGVLGGGSLAASIEASHALLTPAEQELFRRLSVFAGPFRLEDAERVGGGDGLPEEDVLDLLVALTEHSMVQAEGDSPRRYRMLEALRDFGRARLSADKAEAEAAERRHARHFAQMSIAISSRVDHAGAESAADPLVPFQHDIHAAFRRAVAAGDPGLALPLAAGVGAFHHLAGTVTLGRELIEQALALPGGDPSARIAASTWQIALLLCELGLPAAAAAIGVARELVDRHGGPRENDQLRVFEAQFALLAGDLEAAERMTAGIYESAIGRGERYTAGFARWTEGHAALALGRADEAVRCFETACEHMLEVVDVCALDNAAAAHAAAAFAAGREEEAWAICERTLSVAPERPLGERNTYLLHEAAMAAARRGELERADLYARTAHTGARRDPVSIGRWHAPAARGDVALAAGDVAKARAEYGEALDLALGVREQYGFSLPVEVRLALTYLRLAGVAASPREAAEHLAKAGEHAAASRAPAIVGAVEQAAAPAPAALAS